MNGYTEGNKNVMTWVVIQNKVFIGNSKFFYLKNFVSHTYTIEIFGSHMYCSKDLYFPTRHLSLKNMQYHFLRMNIKIMSSMICFLKLCFEAHVNLILGFI